MQNKNTALFGSILDFMLRTSLRTVKVSTSKKLPEAPPPENTDYMFSIRPEFFTPLQSFLRLIRIVLTFIIRLLLC
jgi:hypothetical protein